MSVMDFAVMSITVLILAALTVNTVFHSQSEYVHMEKSFAEVISTYEGGRASRSKFEPPKQIILASARRTYCLFNTL